MIIICGKSGSGKDTVAKELAKRGYRKVITYTTRPMRDGESQDNPYHFVSLEDFEKLQMSDLFLETTRYHVANGDVWKYGTPADNLDNHCLLVMNPEGVRNIIKRQDLCPVVFYLFTDEPERTRRLINRGDDPAEMSRRKVADEIDFSDIGDYCDYVVPNTTSSPGMVADYIDHQYKRMVGKDGEI